MSFELVLIGISIHILVWEKLPEWGTWFNTLLGKLPQPLQTLYAQWRCAYCAGFWIALALHAATGLWTIPALASLPGYWGPLSPFVGWFLDALASAALIVAGVITLRAIGLPAMKSYLMKDDFMKTVGAAARGEPQVQKTQPAEISGR
ncbi:hypothetical protein [Hoeflea sp. TYP-13]|uniref:hypothetical protein n=1 Tax=Hoeflea sp. TYP-13 TaxID=3230023 RepID=UPI0034C655D0